MSRVVLGGKTYEVGLLSWYQVERGWPAIRALQNDPDPILGAGHYFDFLAGILGDEHPELADVAEVKKRTKMTELPEIGQAVREILIENTLITPPGEPQPEAAVENASTEQSTAS
jgi:hypothetical protein